MPRALRSDTCAFAACCVTICAAIGLAAAGNTPASRVQRGAVDIRPFTFTTFDGQQHPSELGKLTVPENRQSASGRRIEVAFVRLAHSGQSDEPPVVFLPPGPGIPSTTLARVPVYFGLFDRLRARGDVLLLDIRGEGMSTPNFEDCPPSPTISPRVFEDFTRLIQQLAASVGHCAAFWRAQGVDLSAYNNDEIAADINELRQALGYTHVRLLGFSAGTDLGLSVLQRHDDTVDRAVFAATGAPEFYPSLPSTLDGQLRKVSALHAAAAPGGKSDLVSLMASDLKALAERPAPIVVRDGADRDATTLSVGPIALQYFGAHTIGNRAAMIPALLQSVHDGDYSLLQILVQKEYVAFHTSMTLIGRTIDCAGPISSARAARVSAEAAGSLFGNVSNVHLQPAVCEAAVGRAIPSTPTVDPVFSRVPTLLISGSMDSNTPPFDAETIRWTLPAGVHVVITNGFHETLPAQQVQDLVVDFFAGHDVVGRSIAFETPRFLSLDEARVAAAKGR
ncbi:MAG TPA: alpha/beta hydrolase [Vicinamibacterales bacterium]